MTYFDLYKINVSNKDELTQEELKNLRSVDELEPVQLMLDGVNVNPYDESVLAILSTKNKKITCILSSLEGSALIFEKSGLANNAHIKNIYQMYFQLMKEIGVVCERVTIESLQGDVLYCKVQWCTNKHRRFYAVCSVGDALIFAVMSKAPIYIVQNVLDKLDDATDWLSEHDIWDDDMDY